MLLNWNLSSWLDAALLLALDVLRNIQNCGFIFLRNKKVCLRVCTVPVSAWFVIVERECVQGAVLQHNVCEQSGNI